MLSGFYKKFILGVTGSTGIATVQLLTNSIIPVAPRQFTVMAQGDNPKKAASIYEFSAKDIDGNDISLEKYRGHVCVIVNVASK